MEVLHNRHSFAIPDIKSSISGALPSHFLDKALSIGVVRLIWRGDPDACKELLEAQSLAVGKPMVGGECIWLPASPKKFQREGEEVPRLIHHTRRDVDIY
jgi:hypothetical protein